METFERDEQVTVCDTARVIRNRRYDSCAGTGT
jgi:hypothetical protein